MALHHFFIKTFSQINDFALEDTDKSYPIPLTLSINLSSSIETILFISFIESELKIMHSSILLRNSGAKVFLSAL
ncbi:MAG: hypothetical protein CM15mP102_16190 [Flavobacteriales bacterium]|nr:MAG: hypothetical protein CM15mP102_16190 [Flavobacteriales bacterium]